jgi:hypothetical protein
MATNTQILKRINEIYDAVFHPIITLNKGNPESSQAIKDLRTQLKVAENKQTEAWQEVYELRQDKHKLELELQGYKAEEKARVAKGKLDSKQPKRKQRK